MNGLGGRHPKNPLILNLLKDERILLFRNNAVQDERILLFRNAVQDERIE